MRILAQSWAFVCVCSFCLKYVPHTTTTYHFTSSTYLCYLFHEAECKVKFFSLLTPVLELTTGPYTCLSTCLYSPVNYKVLEGSDCV